MAGIVIPTRAVESLKSDNGDFIWPIGAFTGLIESCEVKELPSKQDGTPFAGYATANGERLSIQIGDIASADDDAAALEKIGKRKWFLDLVLVDGDYTLETFADAPKEAWQLERSARYIGNLAASFGAIQELDDGNSVIDEAFVEGLRNGTYVGQRVGFSIYHKPNRKDAARPFAEVEYFFAAS